MKRRFDVGIIAVYLRCVDDASAGVLNHYRDLFQTLASAQQVHIVTSQQPPEGCAISTVSARCEVHMMLKVGDFCWKWLKEERTTALCVACDRRLRFGVILQSTNSSRCEFLVKTSGSVSRKLLFSCFFLFSLFFFFFFFLFALR